MIPSFARRDGDFKVNWWPRVDKESDVRQHAEDVLQEIGLYEKRHEIADSMSRGDKRRLEMAMCLSQDPKLLLLDEPTASANYISVLAQGTVIAENTPELIKGDPRVKEAYLGTEAE